MAESATMGESIVRAKAVSDALAISFSKGGVKNVKDTGLINVPLVEIKKKARDKSIDKKERQRYIREEKGKKVRNKKKRK